jgi:hypothetical protein
MRKLEKSKAKEPGKKLAQKVSLLNAIRSTPCPLPYALSFRIPPSHFRIPISVICLLITNEEENLK